MDPYEEPAGVPNDWPPSEAWLFAQAILGKPIPRIVSPETRAREKREELERLVKFPSRHAEELRTLEAAEAEARHDREVLQWAAQISTCAEERLSTPRRKEARQRETERGASPSGNETYWASLTEWDEADHPRQPKGTPEGGEWAPKGGGIGAAGADQPHVAAGDQAAKPANAPSSRQIPATKSHLPADRRGTWIKGTKGDGVFRYNDSIENQEAGVAGKEVRFENGYIAVVGFPAEAYYGGSAAQAGVRIETVTGTNADSVAADAAMRAKLGDPSWQRPEGYKWNHAGPPGSKAMELVREGAHTPVAHKGSAAAPRAFRRSAKGGGTTGRAMGVLSVYLTARDVLQATGALQPDYVATAQESYHFAAEDGSVFIVHPAGLFSSAKREFVAGPRKGQMDEITNAQVEHYRRMAEAEWGKYVPGSLLRAPRFVPGKQRKSLPLFIDDHGVRREAGWIDEDGVHYYSQPKPSVA
ncbi:MAG: HNH endonuclease [Planctomycetia bacterium]|nr:HNH endonuclease [Planctomycetia bacterium]